MGRNGKKLEETGGKKTGNTGKKRKERERNEMELEEDEEVDY